MATDTTMGGKEVKSLKAKLTEEDSNKIAATLYDLVENIPNSSPGEVLSIFSKMMGGQCIGVQSGEDSEMAAYVLGSDSFLDLIVRGVTLAREEREVIRSVGPVQ